jgi:DNA-binding MarR family transcriptional regulator
MNQTYQMYFDFIEDILDALHQYEQNSLSVLVGKNISLNEAKILSVIVALEKDRNNTSSGIALSMNSTRSAISIALKQMEKKNIIIRATDPIDRRRVFVEPTNLGRTIYQTYQEVHNDMVQKTLDTLNDSEKKQLTLLTTALRNHIKSLVD